MVIRLMYLIMGSSLMTLTTTPNNLTDGLEKSLGFLKVIKVPVHEIAMITSHEDAEPKKFEKWDSLEKYFFDDDVDDNDSIF